MLITDRFNKGKQRAEEQWQRTVIHKMENAGTTKYLEILPLIDWYSGKEDLSGEAGVSYLVKTDESSILFDMGWNPKRRDPSSLQRNMKQLGLAINDFDTIVISHNHPDHVGGKKWAKNKSFSLGTAQTDIGKKAVYTPIPMTYPGLSPICSADPTLISKGVITSGTITNQDFFLGEIHEQALAINVEGKGIVIIIGCGHQTLAKILKRTAALFDEPLYGIIGGLHYPVTDSRIKVMGIKMQRYLGSCRVPWKPIKINEVQESIDMLSKLNPKIIGISAHDSCDMVIGAFENAFPGAYKKVFVGEKITIGARPNNE